MTDRIRFHLDENVDPAVADGLRRRGVNVSTTQEMGLLHASDDKQLEFALSDARTIVTHDADFLVMANAGVPHPGIAYCHSEPQSIGKVIAALLLICECSTPDEMRNHVEFL
jgi:predicted nuclease of predicted toxin-antitoxin system